MLGNLLLAVMCDYQSNRNSRSDGPYYVKSVFWYSLWPRLSHLLTMLRANKLPALIHRHKKAKALCIFSYTLIMWRLNIKNQELPEEKQTHISSLYIACKKIIPWAQRRFWVGRSNRHCGLFPAKRSPRLLKGTSGLHDTSNQYKDTALLRIKEWF